MPCGVCREPGYQRRASPGAFRVSARAPPSSLVSVPFSYDYFYIPNNTYSIFPDYPNCTYSSLPDEEKKTNTAKYSGKATSGISKNGASFGRSHDTNASILQYQTATSEQVYGLKEIIHVSREINTNILDSRSILAAKPRSNSASEQLKPKLNEKNQPSKKRENEPFGANLLNDTPQESFKQGLVTGNPTNILSHITPEADKENPSYLIDYHKKLSAKNFKEQENETEKENKS